MCALVRNDGVFENNFRFRMRFRQIGRACCAGGASPSPTVMEIGALESVGAGALDGPFVQSKVFFGGSKPPPYKYERTSLGSVGAIINRPWGKWQ